MPVTPTYPGIYIEELPSTSRTITAAPTSIAVFIGHTHPFKTKAANWGNAVRVFSFTEYEREFGGLYKDDLLDAHVPYAVQQFFLNGGAVAYIVAIAPSYYKPDTTAQAFVAATATIAGVTFTALEPTSIVANSPFKTYVTISNVTMAGAVADITITYGSTAETFRAVPLSDFIVGAGDKPFKGSTLVTYTTAGTTTYVAGAPTPLDLPPSTPVLTPPASAWTTFRASDYTAVLQDNGSLDKVDIFNLMVIPGVTGTMGPPVAINAGLLSQALAFCEKKRAFLIMDPPSDATADGPAAVAIENVDVPKSTNGALYFPYLTSVDNLTGDVIELPPSGYVAGIFARTDNNRGVWKAPAGLETTVNNATGVVTDGRLTDMQAGVLNDAGINALRTFPGVGTVVFGARTLVSTNPAFQQWKYVPVRRMALFIEQTLLRNLGWVVFEPNDTPLWTAIRMSIENFMLSLFRQAAFQGSKPSEAFIVKCDSSTTTQTDIDNGIVNILVGFRPLKPAEFVIIKIAQLAGQAQG